MTDDSDAPLNGVYKLTFTLLFANTGGTMLFTTTEPTAVR